MKTKKIKLFNEVLLIVDGETEHLADMPALWEALGWDIKGDPEADECAKLITRELFCFGSADISALTHGEHSVIIKWA